MRTKKWFFVVVFATELSTTYRKLKLRAGVDSEPERGGPPSVGKPGDLQLGFAIGAGVLEHLICGRRADRPTFRDSHELLAKLSKALLSRKIIWFRVPITLIRVRLFTSKFNRIFLVSTHLSKPQKHYSSNSKPPNSNCPNSKLPNSNYPRRLSSLGGE